MHLLADCLSEGLADPSVKADRALQLPGGPPVLSSACLLCRLIAAPPGRDVSLFQLLWEG